MNYWCFIMLFLDITLPILLTHLAELLPHYVEGMEQNLIRSATT